MAASETKFTRAVEAYLADLRRIRASGGETGERSYYPPLSNLLNAIGDTLKPKVFCVGKLAEQGAGHPDLGLYAAKQVRRQCELLGLRRSSFCYHAASELPLNLELKRLLLPLLARTVLGENAGPVF